MRNAATFIVVFLVLIGAGIVYVSHGFHEAEQIHMAEKARAYQARIERQCRLAFPRSPSKHVEPSIGDGQRHWPDRCNALPGESSEAQR